jgi:hypothetical protein
MHNSTTIEQSRRRGGRSPARRLLAALMALCLTLSAHGARVDAGTSLSKIPDLTGDWKFSLGGVIHITSYNLGGGPGLTNTFKSGGDCKYGGTRTSLFDSANFKDANTMTGLMEACTGAQVLVEKCGLASVFTVDYKTTSISKNSIIGTYTSEWYDPSKGDECKFTRNASKDTQTTFVLTRTSTNPCPDTAAVKAFNKDANRAVTIMSAISRHVTDSQVQRGLSSTQGALNTISGTLGRYVAAGEKCDQIHSVIDDILAFQQAIDQINNAGCDSNALAGGFDNLFRTAGQLGNTFNPLPALGPAFTILSQDQNFFTTVSGNLNPEQRWADQFQNVEGYIPNCTQ